MQSPTTNSSWDAIVVASSIGCHGTTASPWFGSSMVEDQVSRSLWMLHFATHTFMRSMPAKFWFLITLARLYWWYGRWCRTLFSACHKKCRWKREVMHTPGPEKCLLSYGKTTAFGIWILFIVNEYRNCTNMIICCCIIYGPGVAYPVYWSLKILQGYKDII